MEQVFPGKTWQRLPPADLGFSAERLDRVAAWLYELAQADEPFHFIITRYGYLVAEWNKDIDSNKHQSQASAAKSYYSSMLGIAVKQGKLPSLDAKVVDYYPEMMDVPPGEGPKPGRHAFVKDRQITFRQLICNCSGFM
jgi:hypothetical protein